MNLPDLTNKQLKFVVNFVANKFENASEALRNSYDCTNMSDEAINVEASKMLKHPKVALWIEHAKQNVKQVALDEINYSAKDCFNELKDVQARAKEDNNYSQEIKTIELKGKLAGHFVNKHQVTGGGLAEVLDQLK